MASTELRAAAQQALEALELGYDSAKAEADQYHAAMAGYRPQRHAEMDAEVQKIAAAITALRVALAEPDLFHCPKCGGPADNGHDRSIPPSPYWCTKCMAEPVQEPVAWSFEARHIDSAWAAAVTLKHPGPEGKYMRKVTPLYTAPPQRKPLTEEEIDSIWDSEKAFADIYAIARAIERAHGIGA